MLRVAVFSSGGGTNLQSIIDAIDSGNLSGVEISCMITNKPECGAIEKANKAGITVHVIESKGKTREEFDAEVLKYLDPYGIDLIVLGGFNRILSPVLVRAYKDSIINVHPSLLPKHKGWSDQVHKAVIEEGDKETGMTIHFVDEGMDSGPIILQKSVAVDPSDAPETLKAKVQELEKIWYPKVIQTFTNDESLANE